ECMQPGECVATGVKCSDCTFAVPRSDPGYLSCGSIHPTCPDNLAPACKLGRCVLACVPSTCDLSCADGYAFDSHGCATFACAMPAQRACMIDGDCARVRADCCGCPLGGADTAVPQGDVAAHDAALNCPPM